MKVLFQFINSDLISKYRNMGFKVTADDPINDVFYAEMNFEGYDDMAIFAVIDDCLAEKLDCNLQYEDDIYSLKEAYELIDNALAK